MIFARINHFLRLCRKCRKTLQLFEISRFQFSHHDYTRYFLNFRLNFRFDFQFHFHRAAPPQRRTHEAARAAGAVGHPRGAALAPANRLEPPGQASEEGFRADLNI